ncbi:DUF1444 family protein [Flavobacterium mesophilum]|uniref:DUF1444 family protein n=1 Tax=Flavobacterium mesophilum TaxID=3143495 RepID=UPI0031D5DC4E
MFFKKKKKVLTEQEFLEMIKEKLPLSIHGLEVIPQTNGLLLMTYDNNRKTFSFDTEYEKYIENTDSLDEIYAKIKSNVQALMESTKVDAEKILPRIENMQFIKDRIEGKPVMKNVVYRQINYELAVFFVEEREGKFYPLQKSDLVDLGLSIEELTIKAANNLANLPNLGTRNDEGLHSIVVGGLYESSFILLDLLIRNNFSVSGNIVVALPARDTFFITGSEDKKNLSKLREIINKIKDDGHPIISDKLFLLNEYDRFEVFEENGSNADGLLSRNEFTELIIKKLIERIKDIKIVSKESLIIVSEYKGQTITYKYFTCYDEYTKHPQLIDKIIDTYLGVTYDTHMHIGTSVEPSKIFPMIRNKEFLKSASETEHDFEKIIYEKYNEELLIFYVEDRENSIYFIRQQDMIKLNYSVEDLKDKAIENFGADWDVTVTGDEGFYAVSKAKYTASLILMNMWETEYMPVTGDPVITIIHPTKIYVTGSKDQANLFKLYDYMRTVKSETWQHIISDKLFVYSNKTKGFDVLE